MTSAKPAACPARPSSDRIMIWGFKTAPAELRSLYCGASEPEWLALVPQSIYGPDIDDMMLRNSRELQVSRLETGDGDIVFTGCQ
jgi:hypothetical protein